MRTSHFFSFIFLTTFVSPMVAFADEPFETVAVGARYVANINENDYHDNWEQSQGFEIYMGLPFYAGSIELGARFLDNQARTSAVPDYQSMFVYLGWGLTATLPARLRATGMVTLGANLMSFEGEDDVGTGNETEAAAEIIGRAGWNAWRAWSVDASLGYMVMFTDKRIELGFVTVGVSRSFSAPDWLKGILE